MWSVHLTRHALLMLHSTDGCHKSSRVSRENCQSSQRFIHHGGGAGVDGLNASKLESVQDLRSVLVGGACVEAGTPLSWNPSWLIRVDRKAPRSRHLKMTEDAMRAVHQQFTTALEGLTRQSAELQNELAQSRQQAANELDLCCHLPGTRC